MSYKSIFVVYNKDGEYLGIYPGWTSEEAVKKAQEEYVNRQIGKTKLCGTMEQNR